MALARKLKAVGETPVRLRPKTPKIDRRLADLPLLAGVDIETPMVADLSQDLHALFDHVSDDTLPIYFGPLLGRLYLEGL